jgi:wyosine [tRNA(Phe)-imidazoG37] synthetase (radical SAM superfamily)
MYIFGPVLSRRLGRSLGVNIIPEKICSFDCLYCEIGKTKTVTVKRSAYVKADKVLSEFKKTYAAAKNRMDVITVTGYGEPTLNTELAAVLDGIKETARHPVVILTNTSTIHIPEVAEVLKNFDIVIPSLDSVVEEKFQFIDHPHPSVSLNTIKEALIDFSMGYKGKLYIELLLAKGVNDGEEELSAFAEYIKNVRYDLVQLSTVFRPPAYGDIKRLSDEEMSERYLFLSACGVERLMIPGVVCAAVDEETSNLSEDVVCEALRMRPMSVANLAEGLAIDLTLAEVMVEELFSQGRLSSSYYENEIYYSLRK